MISIRPVAAVALAAMAAGCGAAAGPPPSLITTAESTRFARTGRYDEAIRLCRDFARAHREASCREIGRTVEDRPILALTVARSHARPVPTILIVAGIHAGEIEGKDAGFWFLRDLVAGRVAPGALEAVDIVFVPVMNPDGHERFGPNNRPNQRGPAEMGFRTNAANLNLNRDWVKADAPETRAVLGIVAERDPIALIDLHTTDGAKFEHDISVQVTPIAPRGDRLDEAAAELSAHNMRRLAELGHLPVAFYPSFVSGDDPTSGFEIGEPPARFSHGFASARGRFGILVETHSWHRYGERVRATYHALQSVVEAAQRDGARWREVAAAADRADLELLGRSLPLAWETGPRVRPIEFRGYAYQRRPSEISGGSWIEYDESKPEVWKVPLHDELVAAVTVTLPREGYIVDGGFAGRIAAVLDAHGIAYTRIDGQPRVDVEVFRASAIKPLSSFEGRARVELTGAWTRETRPLTRGAIFVSLRQPALRLIAHLFEPASPDSFAAWGTFNAVFEQKEYMESYVLELEARAMLAKDASLRAAFDAALAADPTLAGDPGRRLDWFYRRHPAWDERKDLLPVYRTDRPVQSK